MLTYVNFGKPFAGNLGNNLFQIASLLGMARRYGTTLVLPADWKYADCFHRLVTMLKDCLPEPTVWLEEPYFQCALGYFDQFRGEFVETVVNVKGWLQTEKYWAPYAGEIRSVLEFTPDLLGRIVEENIQYRRHEFVAVSVRRGDYVGNPNYELLPIEYYISALNHFFPAHRVMVFSDDMLWCKSAFSRRQGVYYADTYGPIEQLCFMSTFKNFVLANSTFSWWGAYLAPDRAVVIRPAYHFGRKWEGKINWTDYYPGDWTPFDHRQIEGRG